MQQVPGGPAGKDGAIYQVPLGVAIYPNQTLLVGSLHGDFLQGE